MSHRPAHLYLSLHDDGPVVASVSPARRALALFFALCLLTVAPLVWLSADVAVAATPKAALSHDDDGDDHSGPGGGDDDDDDDDHTGKTGTQSNTATNTANTGVSTKQPTATQSNTATNTGKTGKSTKGR